MHVEQPMLAQATADGYRQALKRTLDVAISALALIGLAPVFLLVAVAIRLDSPGPVFFRQERVGRGGRTFRCFKFRTMRHNCNQDVHRRAFIVMARGGTMSDDPDAPFKLKGDARITRAGALLRRTSLDELPQLINVFRGEMSLVGPRPAIPYETENYDAWQHDRHIVKPGITGLWQVYGRGRMGFAEGIALDVQYALTWTLLLDLKLLALTVPTMLMQKGAR